MTLATPGAWSFAVEAWSEPDAKGRRKPRPIPGSEFVVPVDVVLIAYGFDPVPVFAAGNSDRIEVNSWGGVVVDPNQMTSVPGIFAGGDQVRGPDLVVRAVRDARKAAAGIHRYLFRADEPALALQE